ncbi:MAG: hypothetical protein WB611_28015 [Stellaceae bacterium]
MAERLDQGGKPPQRAVFSIKRQLLSGARYSVVSREIRRWLAVQLRAVSRSLSP